MAVRVHARRYAQAVFEIALQRKELDEWQSDLAKIASLGQDAAFVAAMENPKLSFENKAKLLAQQLAGASALALNLVYLLVDKGRFNLASDIADEYERLLNSYRGIGKAEVVTAIPLSEEDTLKLAERLSAILGKKIVLKSEVDSSVVGGIIARINGKLIDGSTRSQLAALKNELAGVSS